jgi:GTP-binding protein
VTAADLPRVAIIGRQNVGKSTLLNRLLGARDAIADREPGVTRDRLERTVTWRGRTFVAVDTGGYVRKAAGVDALVTRQAERALEGADVVLLVVDASVGVQEEDAALADRLRTATVPVVVAANKVDGEAQEPEAARIHALGLGEPLPVSALHGRGAGELLDRLVAVLPPEPPEEPEAQAQHEAQPEPQPEDEPVFAVVGRPNVGKSSLFNRLVGDERSVVFEESGTTRDAVDALVPLDGRTVRFVDTAGFRRPSRAEGLEYYGFLRTSRAIDRAHVTALVVAADEGVTTEDRRIAARVAEAGRGLVVVANKWDLVPREEREGRLARIRERAAVFPGASVLRTSALTASGVGKVAPALLATHGAWLRRVPTAEVNKVIQRAQGERPAPRETGRIRYASQVAAGPPRFVLFSRGRVPSTYARFLENRLRREFGFDGVPIRFTFRRRRA